jgi:Flp pilus assembly protein TadD
MRLLESGDAHAAATVLEPIVEQEPDKGSLREALARAYYSSGRFRDALEQFRRALEIDPVNHYAHFGAGLCLGKLGLLKEAIGQLKLATVMRPGIDDYSIALAAHEKLAGGHAEADAG